MLNEYFTVLGAIVHDNGGVISQIIGDALIVTYNDASPNDDHAVSAVRTAIAIQKTEIRSTFAKGAILKTRCGINTGDIVVVAIGTKDRLSFTVHGDDVNIAARLEPLNKDYGSYILVGENTVKACQNEDCEFESVGEVTVQGRVTPTKIFIVKY